MNALTALTSVLNTLSSSIRTGLAKDYEKFRAELINPGTRAFYISWNGKDIVERYIDGKVQRFYDNCSVYMKTPSNYSGTAIIEQIDAVINQLSDYPTFTDGSTKRTIMISGVSPVDDDINDVIEFRLQIT